MKSISAKTIIRKFNLKPHPEGGFYRETYRCAEKIRTEALPSRFSGPRSLSTAVYFLLPGNAKSLLHRIKSDELWHFYLGSPLRLVQISPEGISEGIILGQDIEAGQKLQHAVPDGFWFGAKPVEESCFSFVGCTVAPGFDFSDFELGVREKLLAEFPKAEKAIREFTKIAT